jgi:hypothetical protein
MAGTALAVMTDRIDQKMARSRKGLPRSKQANAIRREKMLSCLRIDTSNSPAKFACKLRQ